MMKTFSEVQDGIRDDRKKKKLVAIERKLFSIMKRIEARKVRHNVDKATMELLNIEVNNL